MWSGDHSLRGAAAAQAAKCETGQVLPSRSSQQQAGGTPTPCVEQGAPRHCPGCGCREDSEDWQKRGCISQEVCSQTSDRDRCTYPARMGLQAVSRSLLSKNSSSSGAYTAQNTAATNVTHTHTPSTMC